MNWPLPESISIADLDHAAAKAGYRLLGPLGPELLLFHSLDDNADYLVFPYENHKVRRETMLSVLADGEADTDTFLRHLACGTPPTCAA